MYSSMAEIRKRQRARRKYYRALAQNEIKANPEDEGFISFKNLYGYPDPTPAKADRKDYT